MAPTPIPARNIHILSGPFPRTGLEFECLAIKVGQVYPSSPFPEPELFALSTEIAQGQDLMIKTRKIFQGLQGVVETIKKS